MNMHRVMVQSPVNGPSATPPMRILSLSLQQSDRSSNDETFMYMVNLGYVYDRRVCVRHTNLQSLCGFPANQPFDLHSLDAFQAESASLNEVPSTLYEEVAYERSTILADSWYVWEF